MHWLTRHLKRLTPRQKAIGILALVVIVLAAVWSVPGQAANPPAPSQTSAGNSVQQIVFSDILSPIVNALIRMFSFLTAYIVGLLVLVAQQNNFINSAPVVTGYPIVRDLSNMVFIVALLIIAAGTILRLENYRYNRLLGRLIIMAFLVNLARFITGFFIQTSQVFMLTFVNAFKDIALGNFAYMFGLDAVLTFSQNHTTGTDAALFITLVAGLAMMIIAFSVTLALTVILIVRIIALWILTILSPLAYALRIIPNTERYASRWWSEFGKYTVTGPVLAFFLWLALALTAASSCTGATCTSQNNILFSQKNGTSQDASLQKITSDTESQIGTLRQEFVTEIFDPNRLLTFIVAIIFLIMGMQYAAKSGTFGANFAKSVYERGLGAGATLTGLNAIRDRTLAPIQGYLKERQSRRNAAIGERTAAIGARVDQALSSTVGQAGRLRQGATSATGAAFRGVGQVITGKKTVQQALGDVAAAGETGIKLGTRGLQRSEQRIEEWKQKKINVRGAEMDVTSPRVGVADLRAVANGSDNAMAAASIAELVRRNALDHQNTQDVQLVQRVAGHLGDRQAGNKFMSQVEGVDADLARKAYFGDIHEAETRAKIREAIQARAVSTKIYSRSDLDFLTADENAYLGEEAANHIVNTARNPEEMKKFYNGINEDYRNGLFKRLNLKDKIYEDRKTIAEVTGQVGRAFRDGSSIMSADLTKFVQYRGKKLNDIIAPAAAEDDEMWHTIQSNKDSSVGDKEFGEIAEKSQFHRDALLVGLNGRKLDPQKPELAAVDGLYERLKKDNKGQVTYEPTNDFFQEQEKTRRAIFKVSRGKSLAHDLADENTEVAKAAIENFNKLAKSLKAGDVRGLGGNEYFDRKKAGGTKAGEDMQNIILLAIGKKMNVKEIGEFSGSGPEQYGLAQRAVSKVYNMGKNAPNKSPERKRADDLARNENTVDLIDEKIV